MRDKLSSTDGGRIFRRPGMAWRERAGGAAFAAAALLISGHGAKAQDASDRGLSALLTAPGDTEVATVLKRSRPGYDPRRLRIGGTFWSPSVATNVTYDDNIFGSGVNPKSDVLATISPHLTGSSNWGRHSAGLDLGADIYRYSKYSSQDRVDLNGELSGTLDVRHNANVYGEVIVKRATEPRGIDDSIRSFDKPVRYSSLNTAIFGDVVFGRFYLTAGGTALLTNYDDTTLNGAVFDQDYRDGTVLTGVGRLGVQLTPLTSAYVEYSPNSRTYTGPFDSTGQRFVGGLAFNASRLLNGRVFAGYLTQDFRSKVLEDVSAWTAGANLLWSPTPLITVALLADRDADVSSTDGTSVTTSLGVSADYELRRNIVLSASYGRHVQQYDKKDLTDVTDSYGVALQYFLNANLSVSADYSYDAVNSETVADYDRNVAGVAIRAAF